MRTFLVSFYAVFSILCCDGLAAKTVDVVEIARAFPDGGGYEWKGSGVPEDIRFGDSTILQQGKATYCSGFTFAVVMKTAQLRGLLDGKSVDEIRKFQKNWYGSTEESSETQCAYALAQLGIGHAVKAEDARSGDFLQLWRTNKSGHSVVFLEWVMQDGKPIGVKYRSTQKLTDGIGDRVEYFADVDGKKGLVDRTRIYFGRLSEERN